MKHKLLLMIFVMISTFFLTRPAKASSSQQVGGFEKTPCMFTIPDGVEEGKDVICGYVTIPEQHQNPDGSKIKLAVVIIKSMESPSMADPIFFAQGGPGGSTIDTYASSLLDKDSRLRTNRDIVLFDQRGTYYSKPSLICPEIMEMNIQTLNQNLSREESDQKYMEALEACHSRLQQKGINLSAYNSIENAGDINTIRTSLGYEKINLYGVSYGTLLALHTMRLYPEMLRSVVLDSVVPPQHNFILEVPRTEDRAFTVLFESCKADSVCNQAYPDLEKTFFNLVEKLNKAPAFVQLTDSEDGKRYPALVNGDTFQSAIFQMLYSTEIIPMLPRMIYDAKNGKFEVFQRIESILLFDHTTSYGMYYSVLCAEDADYELKDYDLSGIRPQIADYEADGASEMLNICKFWDVKYLGPELDEVVKSDIPTLLLTGNYDPITPPDNARQAAESLSHSYVVVFPDGGHGELVSSPCADQIFLQFIDNPTAQPDTACLAEHQKVAFWSGRNTLFLSFPIRLLSLDKMSIIQVIFYGLCLLFSLTAFLVYPVTWLVRLILRQPASPRPFLQKLLPWLAALNAAVLFVFLTGFFAGIFTMVLMNDARMFYGFSINWFPLFFLPLVSYIISIVLLGGNITAWKKHYGSIPERLYSAALVLSNCGAALVLLQWGTVDALLQALFYGIF